MKKNKYTLLKRRLNVRELYLSNSRMKKSELINLIAESFFLDARTIRRDIKYLKDNNLL